MVLLFLDGAQLPPLFHCAVDKKKDATHVREFYNDDKITHRILFICLSICTATNTPPPPSL